MRLKNKIIYNIRRMNAFWDLYDTSAARVEDLIKEVKRHNQIPDAILIPEIYLFGIKVEFSSLVDELKIKSRIP